MERVRLSSPRWHGTSCADDSFREVDWATVKASIQALDGGTHQEVYLSPNVSDPETWLCVAGRPGAYVLTGSRSGASFPTYVDLTRPPEPAVAVTVGGQEGLYPANWVVPLEAALAVAQSFVVAGGFECGVEWQNA